MDAFSIRVHLLDQGIGVSALQLRELTPVDHFQWQIVTLGGQILQDPGVSAVGAGLGLFAAWQGHLVEENFA